MRFWHLNFLLVTSLVGCAGDLGMVSDDRPPTTPAPTDVQAEIRDARYFLPIPDRSMGPETGIYPRGSYR